jgi:DNA-binding PucR family transcriptional regulator
MENAFNAANYWQARFDQEKKRADDNLHLASCAATEITALRQRNRELAIDLEQTTEDWKREMARAVDAEHQLEAIRARESRIVDRVAVGLRDSDLAAAALDDIRQILGMTRYVPPEPGVSKDQRSQETP